MTRALALLATVLLCLLPSRPASSFCGFYVARADTKLFNKASQVVLVRDEDRTVLTMSNDFSGSLREFAIVIPVPTFLEKEQIHVGEKALLEHLDAYTAPRLVEYFDSDPCARNRYEESDALKSRPAAPSGAAKELRARSLGVTIEAAYTVGEYDILILSAKQSDGLETWLRENGYRIPDGASRVLGSYLRQGMRFFVAKVNLKEQAKLGFSMLRPIQVAYESPKFMLPIRLGMLNADGTQELFVYALTRQGRVETTNYRTVKLPTGMNIPPYVKEPKVFGDFYRSLFTTQWEKEGQRVVFTEYAWDMSWCDPCAADPFSPDELRQLGVFWLDGDGAATTGGAPVTGGAAQRRVAPPRPMPGGAVNAYVTRLHLRYDNEHFPEDLVFQTTSDRQNFQARFVLQHPWTGSTDCSQGRAYLEGLRKRQEVEAQTLANLTGWEIGDIRRRIGLRSDAAPVTGGRDPWWRKIWK